MRLVRLRVRAKDEALNLVYQVTRLVAIVVISLSERRGK